MGTGIEGSIWLPTSIFADRGFYAAKNILDFYVLDQSLLNFQDPS